MLIGLERYLLVSKPFFLRAHWRRTTVNILVLACAVLVIAKRIPLILNVVFDLNTWNACTTLAQSMNFIIDLLLHTIIPLVVLPLMSVGIYMTVRKSFRWRGRAVWMIPASIKQEVGKKTAKCIHKAMMSVLFVYIFLAIPTAPGGMLQIVIWSNAVKNLCNVMLAWETIESIASLSFFFWFPVLTFTFTWFAGRGFEKSFRIYCQRTGRKMINLWKTANILLQYRTKDSVVSKIAHKDADWFFITLLHVYLCIFILIKTLRYWCLEIV